STKRGAHRDSDLVLCSFHDWREADTDEVAVTMAESSYRAPARQSRSTAPKETVARVVEPFLSALHLLACRLVGSLRKGLGASSSQACLARLPVSRPPAHWPKNR